MKRETATRKTPSLFLLPGINRSQSFYEYYKTKPLRGLKKRLEIKKAEEKAIELRMEIAWKKLLQQAGNMKD